MNREAVILNVYKNKLSTYDTIIITRCANVLMRKLGIEFDGAIELLGKLGMAMVEPKGRNV